MDEEVLTLALELGGLAREEAGGLLLCCQLAMEELAGMLKPGISPNDCGVSYKAAAAKLALEDWLALRPEERPRRFTAGEVTVEQGATQPGQLRRQGLRQMAPWLVDASFFLREVRS